MTFTIVSTSGHRENVEADWEEADGKFLRLCRKVNKQGDSVQVAVINLDGVLMIHTDGHPATLAADGGGAA